MNKINLAGIAIAAAGIAIAQTAAAQTFPDRPVTIFVPSSPGAANDIISRFLADELSELWGQPVVVENKPGGGGTIAMMQAAIADADGYTLLESSSTITIQAALGDLPSPLFDVLQPVARIGQADLLMVAGNRVEIGSVADLIQRSQEGELFAGMTGPGNGATMYAHLVEDALGVAWVPVHYGGTADVLLDMAGGRTDITVGSVPSLQGSLESGMVHPVVTLGENRSVQYPDVPTMSELGYDAEMSIWYGLFAQTDVPAEIVAQINSDVAEVLSRPDAAEYLERMGISVTTQSVSAFDMALRQEIEKWSDLIARINYMR
jgi:tripartite-type tricarboxylate transporter receptor subunit TctC